MLTMLSQNNGGQCLLVNGLALNVFLQQSNEVVVGRLYIGRQGASVEGTEVEPAQGGERWEGGLTTFLFFLLHFVDQLHHLL